MSHLAIGVFVFAFVLGGVLAGMFARTVLPAQHLADDSKDVIKLGMGLVATMTALILGFMVASAKSAFEAQDTALKNIAANVIKLDRVLAGYGPETGEIRQMVRRAVIYRLHLTWPEDGPSVARLDAPEQAPAPDLIESGILGLAPKNDAQRWLQSQALQITSNVLGTRWLVLARDNDATPLVFLVVVVSWLTVLFMGFGLFAPRNATVTLVLCVCGASVASALFLILELGEPYDGLVKLSSAPLRYAVSQLGQ